MTLSLLSASSPRRTLRSEIGKIDLDRTFEERGTINASVVMELDKASDPWGVKVLRYEIKNINPPAGRALGDGEADACGAGEEGGDPHVRGRAGPQESTRPRAASSRSSRSRRPPNSRRSTRPEGEAEAILTVATATAEGLRRVADALQTTGGDRAMQLRIAEQYIEEFGRLAKTGNTFVVPANLSDIASMIALATGIAKKDVV